jgi:hypothetical protein
VVMRLSAGFDIGVRIHETAHAACAGGCVYRGYELDPPPARSRP